MSSPIREKRPEPLISLEDLELDTSAAALLAQDMYWQGASQGPDCLVDGYFGHDIATRRAQLSIMLEFFASPDGDMKDPLVLQAASCLVLKLWGIKQEEVQN